LIGQELVKDAELLVQTMLADVAHEHAPFHQQVRSEPSQFSKLVKRLPKN
jgi:hypothetical protein